MILNKVLINKIPEYIKVSVVPIAEYVNANVPKTIKAIPITKLVKNCGKIALISIL